MKLFIGGAWRQVTSAKVYVGGQWRTITRVMGCVSAATGFKTFAALVPPVTVSISPASADASGSGSLPQTLTTNTVTATPSGGLAPYTYAWTAATTLGNAITVASPTLATTAFRQLQPTGTTFGSGAGTVIVTDALGGTATAGIPISFDKIA